MSFLLSIYNVLLLYANLLYPECNVRSELQFIGVGYYELFPFYLLLVSLRQVATVRTWKI